MQDGGEFIVCSTEKTFKKGDKLEPHQLALNNALKTFKQPRNFGKPSDEYINAFTSYFSFLPSRSMLVGDRLEDMEIGNRMGMTTAAVMSGDINRGNLSDARPVQKPDIGVSNLNRLKRKIDGIQFK
jgi:ribonucleotide monophosphatase NagD (HAD superfamily)